MSDDFRARFRAQVQAETGKTPDELISRTPAGVTRKLTYDADADPDAVARLLGALGLEGS